MLSFGPVGHIVSVTTAEFCLCSERAAIDTM